jgi:preprotein translocase subunit SecD
VNKKITVCLVVILTFISTLLSSCTIEQNTVIPSPSPSPTMEKGVTILLEADLSKTSENDKAAIMTQTIDVISKRLNNYGVAQPTIQQQGDNRIFVELPENIDIDNVKKLISRSGYLELRKAELSSEKVVALSDYLTQENYKFIDVTENGSRIFVFNTNNPEDKPAYITVAVLKNDNGIFMMTDMNGNLVDDIKFKKYSAAVSWIPARDDNGTQLTGAYVEDTQAIMDNTLSVPKPEIKIKWNGLGSIMFDQIATSIHNEVGFHPYDVRYAVGFFLDNNLLMAPQILQTSYGGTGVISGNFTKDETIQLADMINAGALPVQVKIIE